jgi:hypothetical protein
MIYLIGIDHIKSQWEYQNGSNKNFVSSFTNILRRHIKGLKVTVIAEELNQECLDQQGVATSTAQKVAEEFCLKHVFCEPPVGERTKLGILSKEEISRQLYHKELWLIPDDSLEQQLINEEHQKYFPKRERFWLDKIENLKEEIILFICGKSHVERFKKLLEGRGVKITVLSN